MTKTSDCGGCHRTRSEVFASRQLAVIAEGIAHRAHADADAGPGAAHAASAVPELVAAGLGVLGTP